MSFTDAFLDLFRFSVSTKNSVLRLKYGCFCRKSGVNALLVALPELQAAVGSSFHMFARDGSGILSRNVLNS